MSDKLYALTADPNKPLREAHEEIARLRAERDEARREVCGHDETIGGAMLEADRRGWDCFKEDGK